MTSGFAQAESHFADTDPTTIGNLIAGAADIALVVDRDGTIRDVSQANDGLDGLQASRWPGTAVEDVVTIESRPKIRDMLDAAREGRQSGWRQVNHPADGEDDFPVQYSAIPAGSGRIVFVGREQRPVAALQTRLISAQQALERDYERHRRSEARYRQLFQIASDAFLVVDAGSGRIDEANPRAADLLGHDADAVRGRKFASLFDRSDRRSVDAMLASVLAGGQSDTVEVVSSADDRRVVLEATLFRAADLTLFLVRVSAAAEALEPVSAPDHNLHRLLQRAAEAVVLTDQDGRIQWANQSFLDMAGIALTPDVVGRSLGDYLDQTEASLGVVLGNVRRHGRLRLFATRLRGDTGQTVDVELSAVALPQGTPPGFGIVMRDVSLRVASGKVELGQPASVEHLTELIGRVPLKELVRDTTDIIEKMCIEAALRLTDNNRALTAKVLGLSRQGLYVKLRRYGMDEATAE